MRDRLVHNLGFAQCFLHQRPGDFAPIGPAEDALGVVVKPRIVYQEPDGALALVDLVGDVLERRSRLLEDGCSEACTQDIEKAQIVGAARDPGQQQSESVTFIHGGREQKFRQQSR